MKAKSWVTVSKCPPEITREYWETEEEAKVALSVIDQTACGGQCKVDAVMSRPDLPKAVRLEYARRWHYIEKR